MKEAWLATLMLVGLAVPVVAQPNAQPNYRELQRNIVKILAYHGEAFETGTGIVAGRVDGGIDILTDLHVVAPLTGSPQRPDPPSKIEVFFAGDRLVPIAATWSGAFDAVLDLTAIRVTDDTVARQSEALRDLCVAPDKPKDSDRVSVMGHGLQDWQTLVNLNAVLAPQPDTDYRTFLVSTIGMDRGFSGGPVFSAAGCVVGIVRQLSVGQAIVTRIADALGSATALGFHVELFRGSAPIDTQAKAQAFAELAKVLRTYLFNAGGVVAVYGRPGPPDRKQLAQTNVQYTAAYESLFNDRERYRLAISTLWNDRRLRPFDGLLDNLDRFHKQFIFGGLERFVIIFRSRTSLSDAEQRDLSALLDAMRAALPLLDQQAAAFIDDLQR